MLDPLDLPWLGTEQEMVSCVARLWIERDLLSHRTYAGQAKGLIHYFSLKRPVAVVSVVFVYVDPGMGSRSELDSRVEVHRCLCRASTRQGGASKWLRSPGSRSSWTVPSEDSDPLMRPAGNEPGQAPQ